MVNALKWIVSLYVAAILFKQDYKKTTLLSKFKLNQNRVCKCNVISNDEISRILALIANYGEPAIVNSAYIAV